MTVNPNMRPRSQPAGSAIQNFALGRLDRFLLQVALLQRKYSLAIIARVHLRTSDRRYNNTAADGHTQAPSFEVTPLTGTALCPVLDSIVYTLCVLQSLRGNNTI